MFDETLPPSREHDETRAFHAAPDDAAAAPELAGMHRIPEPTAKDLERMEQYRQVRSILEAAVRADQALK